MLSKSTTEKETSHQTMSSLSKIPTSPDIKKHFSYNFLRGGEWKSENIALGTTLTLNIPQEYWPKISDVNKNSRRVVSF